MKNSSRPVVINAAGKFSVLDIEHESEFFVLHTLFTSVAQAIMYYRVEDPDTKEQIYGASDIDSAKEVSFQYTGDISKSWRDNGPGNVMYSIVKAKLDFDQGARDLLLSTGNAQIVCYGEDLVMFVDKKTKQGLNLYGKVLQQLRGWYRFKQQMMDPNCELGDAGDLLIQRRV